VIQSPQHTTSAGNVAAETSRLAGVRTRSPHQRSGSRGGPPPRAVGGQHSEALHASVSEVVGASVSERSSARACDTVGEAIGETAPGNAGETINEKDNIAAAPREDSADLDRKIRALSGRASRCRLIEGWLAWDLLEHRKWQPLGFVRLRDYTRERLGIGARGLQEEVRVVRALQRLPLLTASFLDGTLSWTTVRLLIDVASMQDEAQWIENARGLSSRALAALVREAPHVSSDACIEDDEDEDPRLRWSVRVSLSGRLLWRTASEFAQRIAGSTLTPAQVLELVAAEAGSGDTESTDFQPPPTPECLALLERLRNGSDEPAPAKEARHGQPATDASGVAAPTDDDSAVSSDGDLHALAEGEEATAFASREREARNAELPPCDETASTILDSAWFEKLMAELGEAEGFPWLATPTASSSPADRLEDEAPRRSAADPHTIDTRLREVRRALQALDFEMASLLREAADRRLYRSLGFANLELYVESCLGICARTAWSLLAVERATRRSCPLLGEAWREGRVSWLATRILAPVVNAAHGKAWIERAQIVTLRRLEAEITWAQNRRDEQDSFEIPGPPPVDHDLGDAVAALTIPGLQMRAQAPGPDVGEGYLPKVQIDFFAPESVVGLAEDTLLRLRAGSEPRGHVFERMLALAMLEWMSAPAHRDPVFDRDGWRCAVPGCSSRRNLHDHHVVFRSQGGGNGRDNRITACAAHHLHGLHRGRVRAHGTAPDGIFWELGCRPRGDGPLARLFGDRYV